MSVGATKCRTDLRRLLMISWFQFDQVYFVWSELESFKSSKEIISKDNWIIYHLYSSLEPQIIHEIYDQNYRLFLMNSLIK